MVGCGGIAGGIFAGLLSKTVAGRVGTESLLLAMTLFVLICAGLGDLGLAQRASVGGLTRSVQPEDPPKQPNGTCPQA